EEWNPGVIGLAASRIVEKYKWPAILLSQSGEICVGSARSIPGVDIHAAMSECRDLFIRFGGHAQAAGLTIEKKNVEAFRRRLTEAIRSQAQPEAFIPTEEYDLELELGEMTEELVEAFSAMQPTGFGNPAPVFCVRGVHTADVRQIGKEGAHLRMRLMQGSEMRNAIAFRMGDRSKGMPEVIEAVIGLSINQWQDRRSVQCEIRQMQAYMPGKAFLTECQRRAPDIDAAMLRTLAAGGKPVPEGRIERMDIEEVKAILARELLTAYQGTLLSVHTIPALKMINIHMAIVHAQLDYALGALEDRRMFNTLIMAPEWKKIACMPRCVIALDGFLNDAERAAACEQFSQARIIEATGLEQQTSAAALALLPPDEGLRAAYRVLRQREKTEYTMNLLATQTGMTESMLLCALHIFSELGLAEFTPDPFRYRLLPSGRVSLESSAVRARLIELAARKRRAP
ncbi:MAG: DHHA1 domain-containing protein, partial [Clostridia bacterium]|nr:DHHA1 domain-containing protein [Clostridia bacterium]